MIRSVLHMKYNKGIIIILFLFSNFEMVNNKWNNEFKILHCSFIQNKANHKWAISGKQNWRCGIEPNEKLKCQKWKTQGTQKGCRFIETAGRWPRKSDIRQEVCNNLPAEWIGPENGWR